MYILYKYSQLENMHQIQSLKGIWCGWRVCGSLGQKRRENVRERERKWERVSKREREDRKREGVCACVFVQHSAVLLWEFIIKRKVWRDSSVFVCQRERERVCVWVCVCVCMFERLSVRVCTSVGMCVVCVCLQQDTLLEFYFS